MISFKELKKNLKKDTQNMTNIKVSILGDSATQLLSTAIKGFGIEKGCKLDLYESDYNQIELQVFDPNSEFHQFGAKYNIIFQSTHKLMEKYAIMGSSEQDTLATNRINLIKDFCSHISGCVIVYNYPEIDDSIFGSYACNVQSSFIYQIRKLNFELMNLTHECKNLYVCDIASIQNKFGRNFMFDSKVYVSTEILFSIDSLPYVASKTVDIIQSIEGKSKKCLILDLDNTLWGGIVGDDGWENIQIGHGLGIGKAFTEFQQWVKKLKNRGIIIAICSKNDEIKAKEPFETNSEMVLRLDDISVFIANWNNKADNIRIIQSILNIGFDSMVFLDDNPFERNIVRENINDIVVPELPEDPSEYLEYLYSLNLFETVSYSIEDNDRTKQYQVEAQRVVASKSFTNEEDFLKSLNMVAEIEVFNNFNSPRVAQLSLRSNQFNLRTVRYTLDQILAMRDSSKYSTFAFSLKDKFGDNGLIAVVIMERVKDDTLFIDSWFMSCRVLKRGMECFTINSLVSHAKENDIKYIIGEYLPTLKNGIVKDHYIKLGFSKIDGSSTDQFILKVDEYIERYNYINNK